MNGFQHRAYGDRERAAIARLLSDLEPGEWGDLGLCYGPPNCPYADGEAAIAAGVKETLCPSCRVIHIYRSGALSDS